MVNFPVLFEKLTKSICKITLNRPAKRNAVNLEVFRLLNQYLQLADNDDDIRSVIITGAGGYFCSGYDLNEFVDGDSISSQNVEQMLLPIGSRLCRNKLTIAAIEKYAVGFGLELALRCDFRIVDDDAKFGFLNRRFGVPILNGGSVLLPHLVSSNRALELLATGRLFDAKEANNLNIITFVNDIGCSVGKSFNFARSFEKFELDCIVNDTFYVKHTLLQDKLMDSFMKERFNGLRIMKSGRKADIIKKFLLGQACRHGKTDLGTFESPKVEVTL